MMSFESLLRIVFAMYLMMHNGYENVVEAALFHRFDARHSEAMRFIDSVQQPENCTGLNYAMISIGIQGGFAAQFQLAAREWRDVFAAYNFSVPVLIDGHIIGYSDNKACDEAHHEWTCYFQSMSICEAELRKTGKRISSTSGLPTPASIIPPQFQEHGENFWWGVIQSKMFRLQPHVEDYVLAQAAAMNHGHGFPFGLPVAGLHVRHGDKKDDGFRHHSLTEEMAAIQKSPDCALTSAENHTCFSAFPFHHHGTLMLIHRASKSHTPVINATSIDAFSFVSPSHNAEISLDPKKLWLAANHHHHHSVLHSGTTTHTATGAIPHGNSSSGANTTNSSSGSKTLRHMQPRQHHYYLPLHVFVASDDGSVIESATERGYLTDPTGVSQQTTTATTGMLKTLLSHPEIAHRATLEIISDIYFLSQCSTLVGVSASQVYRMAVSLANATGTLHFAAALDGDQIGRVQQLSRKYNVPFPEEFDLIV